MATKLFLRNTQNNGIGATYYDMVTTAGSASDTGVVNTVASGTEIQWTKTADGSILQWVSGRAPAGGFTLTTTDISVWCHESHMNANAGGLYRVFKRTSLGVETELLGGPFNDGVEFGTAAAEMLWAGNVTDTGFAEDDRILLKLYITNVGTMGGGFTCTVTFNGADAATGDSFFNVAETITFKSDPTIIEADGTAAGSSTATATGASVTVVEGSGTSIGAATATGAAITVVEADMSGIGASTAQADGDNAGAGVSVVAPTGGFFGPQISEKDRKKRIRRDRIRLGILKEHVKKLPEMDWGGILDALENELQNTSDAASISALEAKIKTTESSIKEAKSRQIADEKRRKTQDKATKRRRRENEIALLLLSLWR